MAALLLTTATATACQDADDPAGENDEVALWRLDENTSLRSNSTSFTALVTRLECASGVTGKVLAPAIDYSDDEIIVTFTVADNDEGAADCQGNDAVPWEVELNEPLGERRIVDGQCLSDSNASTTSFCQPSAVRYAPARRTPVAMVVFSGRIAFPHLTLTTWGRCAFVIERVERVDARTMKVFGRDAVSGCTEQVRRRQVTERLTQEHRRGGEFVDRVVVVSHDPGYTVDASVRHIVA